MGNENKNVFRLFGVNVTDIIGKLKNKMFGAENATKHIVVKFPDGSTESYTPKGGDAEFNSMKITGFPIKGNVQADGDGNLFIESEGGDIRVVLNEAEYLEAVDDNTIDVIFIGDIFTVSTDHSTTDRFYGDTLIFDGCTVTGANGNLFYNKVQIVNTVTFDTGQPTKFRTLVGDGTIVSVNSNTYFEFNEETLRSSGTFGEAVFQWWDSTNRNTDTPSDPAKPDKDRLLQFFNGAFIEHYDVTAIVVGAEVVVSLFPVSGTVLTPIFDADYRELDFTVPQTVNLSQGTDELPLLNYVYFDSADNLLKQNTTGFPEDRQVSHIAQTHCPTYTGVNLYGLDTFQAFTDHLADQNGVGHLQHINFNIRGNPAKYKSGMLLQATGGAGIFDISVAVGVLEQLHLHSSPAYDTSGASVVKIYNDFVTPNKVVPNMVDQLTDSVGGSMSGKAFSWVFWEIVSESNTHSHLVTNAPSGSYNNDANAIADLSKYSNKTIPLSYQGLSTLLARVTVSHSSGSNTYTIIDIEDLRGSTGAGGGVSGETPPLADTIAVSGLVDISSYTPDDRVMSFIRDNILRFTVWGDGKVAIRFSEIATLAVNSIINAKSLIVKATIIDANIGSPVLKDAVTNIGAGAVIPERYEILGTELGDLDGSYIEDTGTGELFAGYKTWFIFGTDKRLRPVAEVGAGAVFAYAFLEEAVPTQYSILYSDGSDAYFQETADPDNIDNSSYSGNGVYLGDNAGVVYFDAQTNKSLRVEGKTCFQDNVSMENKLINLLADAVEDGDAVNFLQVKTLAVLAAILAVSGDAGANPIFNLKSFNSGRTTIEGTLIGGVYKKLDMQDCVWNGTNFLATTTTIKPLVTETNGATGETKYLVSDVVPASLGDTLTMAEYFAINAVGASEMQATIAEIDVRGAKSLLTREWAIANSGMSEDIEQTLINGNNANKKLLLNLGGFSTLSQFTVGNDANLILFNKSICDTNTPTVTNYWVETNFLNDVTITANRVQTARLFGTGDGKVWTREYTSSWSAWIPNVVYSADGSVNLTGLATSQATPAEILSEPDALVTVETLEATFDDLAGELRLTIPALGVVNVSSEHNTDDGNAFTVIHGHQSLQTWRAMKFGFSTDNVLMTIDNDSNTAVASITKGYSFTNSSSSGSLEVTIKAIGNTDITQLTVTTP